MYFILIFQRNYQQACDNMEYLQQCVNKQVYMFEYFDIAQVLDDNRIVESIHHFEVKLFSHLIF